MPASATPVVTWSTGQMILEMVPDHLVRSVTTLLRKAAVLWYRRQMEKMPYYDYYSRANCSQNQRSRGSARLNSLDNSFWKRLWLLARQNTWQRNAWVNGSVNEWIMLSRIWVLVRGVLRAVMPTYFFRLTAVSARRKMPKQAYKFNVTEENREESGHK